MIRVTEPAASPNPWLVHTARIRQIVSEIDQVLTYDLELVDTELSSDYRFLPGQFNMLYLPGCGEVAISLSGPTRATAGSVPLIHTIRTVGRVTEALAEYVQGDTLGLRGPYGTAWPVDQLQGRDVILLAGGIGLAPLRPVIYDLMAQPDLADRKVLLMGARTPELMLYAEEFQQWRQAGWEVITTVDRVTFGSADQPWRGNVGVVPKLLEQLDPLQPQRTTVMTCGPEIMMHYAAQAALQRGIAPQAIWVSLERNMQCAVGLCGHCQLGRVFVCKDGPVFRYDQALPLMRVKQW